MTEEMNNNSSFPVGIVVMSPEAMLSAYLLAPEQITDLDLFLIKVVPNQFDIMVNEGDYQAISRFTVSLDTALYVIDLETFITPYDEKITRIESIEKTQNLN